jgi:outer membrane protein assembly factor BamB
MLTLPQGFSRGTLWLLLLLAAQVRPSTADDLPPRTYSDWPHWLGPDRNGTSPEKGMLREWPEQGPKLLWKAANRYAGYGAPSISRGELFVLGGSRGTRGVRCVNAFTGEQIWEFGYECRKDKMVARKIQPTWGYCPRATAAVTDKHVYTIDELGELFCLDRKTGKEVWFRDLDTEYGPNHYDWKGWCASPLIEDNVLCFCVQAPTAQLKEEARFIGIDATTGKTLWTYHEPAGRARSGGGDLYHTAAVASFGSDPCFVTLANSRLVAIRVKDGKPIWKQEDAHHHPAAASPQIIQGRFVLVAPFDKNLDKGRLYEVDFKNAPHPSKLVWETPDLICPFSTPVCHDEAIYAFCGPAVGDHGSVARPAFTCLDLKTGKIRWQTEPMAAGLSLIGVDGLLILHVQNEVWLVEPNPEKLVVKGKVKLETKDLFSGWIVPVVAYGRLYIRTTTDLLCYQLAEKVPAEGEVAAGRRSP